MRYYLDLMPRQRRNIFVLALINFMVDVKNLRRTAWSFASLAVESASMVSPMLILRTISERRRIPPCSPAGSIHIARARREDPAILGLSVTFPRMRPSLHCTL